jgi:hypothetical protein
MAEVEARGDLSAEPSNAHEAEGTTTEAATPEGRSDHRPSHHRRPLSARGDGQDRGPGPRSQLEPGEGEERLASLRGAWRGG